MRLNVPMCDPVVLLRRAIFRVMASRSTGFMMAY